MNAQETQDGPRVALDAMAAFLANQPDVVAAYLFGSVAEGTANAMSDVDVAVLLAPGVPAEAELERQIELGVELDRFADREVQLVMLNSAPPVLAHQVVRHGRLLFERRADERIAFESLVYRLYWDYAPRERAFYEMATRCLEEMGNEPG